MRENEKERERERERMRENEREWERMREKERERENEGEREWERMRENERERERDLVIAKPGGKIGRTDAMEWVDYNFIYKHIVFYLLKKREPIVCRLSILHIIFYLLLLFRSMCALRTEIFCLCIIFIVFQCLLNWFGKPYGCPSSIQLNCRLRRRISSNISQNHWPSNGIQCSHKSNFC